jgi:hypothetical protein
MFTTIDNFEAQSEFIRLIDCTESPNIEFPESVLLPTPSDAFDFNSLISLDSESATMV